MSDWEDFCSSLGYDHGSPADYDRMVDMLDGAVQPRHTRVPTRQETYLPRFDTIQDASVWSRQNGGHPVEPGPGGTYFVPAIKKINSMFQPVMPDWIPLRKRYPATNPVSALWRTGSCPTTGNEVELFDIDQDNALKVVWPLLKKLSPPIFRIGERHLRRGEFARRLYKHEENKDCLAELDTINLSTQSRDALYLLLTLAEEEAEHCRRWDATRSANVDRFSARPLKLDDEALQWFVVIYFDTTRHNEANFWYRVGDTVMQELVRRI